MTVFSSGISMYAMAKLIQTLHVFDSPIQRLGLPLSWVFPAGILVSALVVLAYIFLGGLSSAIYNEVLQFFLIVAGFLPLVWLGLRNVGGWEGLRARLGPEYTRAWAGMTNAHTTRMGVEWFGLAMGLGFVLSFGYWCTDFLVVQRAMAADSMSAARRTPLIAAFPKMFFPMLVILPGLIAIALPTQGTTTVASANGSVVVTPQGAGIIPVKVDPETGGPMRDKQGNLQLDYDLAIPNMLLHYFPTGILGLGLTALLASFMSGMAGNVTAFNTVWTYDIYQSYINRKATDQHYLWMGRMATIFGIGLSIIAAFMANRFNNIMDLTAALHHGATLPVGAEVGVKGGWLHQILHIYPSEMAQNFWTAIFAWTACFVVTILVSLFTKPQEPSRLAGLVYSLTERPSDSGLPWYQRPMILAVIVLAIALLLNIIFA
jgi:SSS family solute:Na+ symporter